MGRNVFVRVARHGCLLLFVLECLSPGVARARIDAMGFSAGALTLESAHGAQIGLSEHQIRQLIAADAKGKDLLLTRMVSDIRNDLRRQNPAAQIVPEKMLQARLLIMLGRGVPPEEWEEQLTHLVLTHDALWRHLSSLLTQRTGVEDRLIRASTALASGDVMAASVLLDAELQDSDSAADHVASAQRQTADASLSGLLAARGLAAALLEDGDVAKRMMLRSAALREAGTTERAEALLQAMSVSAVAGDIQGSLDVVRQIQGESESVLSSRPTDAVWRYALWVAQLVIGVHAAEKMDVSTAIPSLKRAANIAPRIADSQPVHWSRIWVNHYLLAAMQQQVGDPDGLVHRTEALRLSKELTSRRPDWPLAWLFRALSDSLAVTTSVGRPTSETDLEHLLDAMSSLDRVESLGHASDKALEVRLQVLGLLQDVRLDRGEEAQAKELLRRASDVADELKRSREGRGGADLDRTVLTYKQHQATVLRRIGQRDQAMAALREAVALLDRVDEGGRPVIALSVHTLLGDVALSAGQFSLAVQQWRLAVQKAELLIGQDGPRSTWELHLWQGLLFLGNSLGKQSLTEEAVRTNERAYEVAQRGALAENGYGEWHRRLFRTVMDSVELHRQRGSAIMDRYEAAARIPRALYGSGGTAGHAAEDLWTVLTDMGNERSKRGEQNLARVVHGQALEIAERALQAMPTSDEWLKLAASTHEQLAEMTRSSENNRLEVTHWQAALDLSARRSPASRDSSDQEKERWLRLFKLSNAQRSIDLADRAFETMLVARELARRFAAQRPDDRYWQEYLWFSESGMGDLLVARHDLIAADGAYEASVAVAEAMIAKGQMLETWWGFAADSLEAQAEVRKQLGRELDARRAAIRASDFRLKLQDTQRAAKVRADVKEQVGGVLDALDLTEERASALPKADLVSRLEAAIGQTAEAGQAAGMNGEKSERIRRLRNALFVVRQLPD